MLTGREIGFYQRGRQGQVEIHGDRPAAGERALVPGTYGVIG